MTNRNLTKTTKNFTETNKNFYISTTLNNEQQKGNRTKKEKKKPQRKATMKPIKESRTNFYDANYLFNFLFMTAVLIAMQINLFKYLVTAKITFSNDKHSK